MAIEGQFPKSDGDILYASEVNLFEASRWNDLVYTEDFAAPMKAILAHTATAWTIVNDTSTFITSDAGVSWTAANADIADMTGVSKANGVKGISCDHNSGNISITGDSGDNWASASTDPAAITRVFDLSFPTSTVAVVACDLGAAARGIFFSTDSGDTWTICTSGPGADVLAIDMVDGSDGLALESGTNRLWTTADGGDNWNDSTKTTSLTPGVQTSLIALTNVSWVILSNSERPTIETGNTTDGATKRFSIMDVTDATSYLSNLVKTTNGNIYFVHYQFHEDGTEPSNATLYRSEDSGVTWSCRALGHNSFEVNTDLTTYDSKSQLVEYDTNKLLFIIGLRMLMKIDGS